MIQLGVHSESCSYQDSEPLEVVFEAVLKRKEARKDEEKYVETVDISEDVRPDFKVFSLLRSFELFLCLDWPFTGIMVALQTDTGEGGLTALDELLAEVWEEFGSGK